MSGAARQRLHRARERDGRIVLPVEVDEVAVTDMLLRHGMIRREDLDDRACIAAALGRVISTLAMLPALD